MGTLLWLTSSGKKTRKFSKSRETLFNLHYIFQSELEQNNNIAMAALFKRGKQNPTLGSRWWF